MDATEYLGTPEGWRYSTFVRGQHTAVVDFSDDSEQIETDDVAKILRDHVPLAEANSVGSRMIRSDGVGSSVVRQGRIGYHKPVLDLDMDVLLLPSSTRGHHHLYVDKPMTWREYSLLMNVLAHVGILQEGYVRASHHRAESFLRTPWTRKA